MRKQWSWIGMILLVTIAMLSMGCITQRIAIEKQEVKITVPADALAPGGMLVIPINAQLAAKPIGLDVLNPEEHRADAPLLDAGTSSTLCDTTKSNTSTPVPSSKLGDP